MSFFRRAICLVLLLLLSMPFCVGIAQGEVLTLDSVLGWVMRDHPLVRLAENIEARGPAALQAARGAFDPVVTGSFDRKDYLGTEYFEYTQGGVSWQTPYALKLEAGREWASGEFFNPEQTVPEAGQAYLSVKLPLLQGLLLDKYRTDISVGKLEVERNLAAAQIVLNELRFDASLAYNDWAYAKAKLRIYQETEQLLLDYLNLTRGLLEQGDKPAVDTLEAALYLLDQQLVTQAAEADLIIAEQALRSFYFAFEPGRYEDSRIGFNQLLIDDIPIASNPELLELNTYLEQLDFKRELKREYLKPQLDVGYSILGDGFQLAPRSDKVDDRNFFTRAYKVGAEFRYPIFNRQARGDLELATLQLAEATQKRTAKRQELLTKSFAYQNAYFRFATQVENSEGLVSQAESLLRAERELFDLGESTQFLLNARAQTLQKAKLTAAKAVASQVKAYFNLCYVTARWPE